MRIKLASIAVFVIGLGLCVFSFVKIAKGYSFGIEIGLGLVSGLFLMIVSAIKIDP